MNIWLICGGLSLVFGFLLFKGILALIPYLEKKNTYTQKQELLEEAKKQRDNIISDAASQDQEAAALFQEDLAADLAEQKEELVQFEQEIQLREQAAELENDKVIRLEEALLEKEAKTKELDQQLLKNEDHLISSKKQLVHRLEQTSQIDSQNQITSLAARLIESRQLEAQKVLKLYQEDIYSSSKKMAQRLLSRALSRYEPRFVWPKHSNTVEVASPSVGDLLLSEKHPLLSQLEELAQITVTYSPFAQEGERVEKDREHTGLVRVAGGYGIYREAARLALTELLAKGPLSWKSVGEVYKKHKNTLEIQAIKLGKDAVTILGLSDIHPEIQKLVGALNWRTSYRQNQWYHTLEVAILAGIIASELDVNPEDAKRVGMLHDIGKALDYRIDGSHAVISGDYADRYGEKRMICDTVMSHHADLIVESPLAYVLRAADTLSGARPGARVNLEEGYQIRLGAIYDAIQSFGGIADIAIMNGGREVHIEVNYKKVHESELPRLSKEIAKKIEDTVAFPGQIKILVTRPFESVTVA